MFQTVDVSTMILQYVSNYLPFDMAEHPGRLHSLLLFFFFLVFMN